MSNTEVKTQKADFKGLVEELFTRGAQFGHKTSKYHPGMAPYLWGTRNSMHLIDLNKTAFLIKHACEQIEEITSQGGQILWVGTKRQAQHAIAECGAALHHPIVIHRWIGGTLTNSEQVRKAVTKLLHMRDVIAKPLVHYKKKQISMLRKDLDRLEKNVSGIINLRPGLALLVVVDVKRETTAVKEASRLGIPVIGIVDTNSSPEEVSTIIPANDDSKDSVTFILNQLSQAAQRGMEKYRLAHPEKFTEEVLAAQAANLLKEGGEQAASANPERKKDMPTGSTFAKEGSSRHQGLRQRSPRPGNNNNMRPGSEKRPGGGFRRNDSGSGSSSGFARRGGRPLATTTPRENKVKQESAAETKTEKENS